MNPTLMEIPEVAPANGADTEALYEVIDGQRKELPPMGAYETSIASALDQYLGPFVRTHNLGRVAVDMLFNLAPLNKQRRPDVAFVSYARWNKTVSVPRTNAWDVVPDLAVEVVSPTDAMVDVIAKVHEYFKAGVQRVWVVLPGVRQIYLYTSPTQVQILTDADSLNGETVIPGFQLPVGELFEGETSPAGDNGAG